VGLSLSLPIMLLLIPRWGIEGAAVALLASTCARFIFIYASFRLVLKVSAPSLLPRKEDFFILLNALKRLKRVRPA
jgi:O-antigen/teichoic acid export membrane protein